MDDCTTDASRPGVEDEQGGIRKEGRKGGWFDAGGDQCLAECTSAHLHMPTSAQVATMLGWLHKQMPPPTCSAPGIWNEEGRKHPRAWLGFRRKIN